MRAKGNGLKRENASWAFTLVELLTVIAIISVLAAMLTGLSGIAASKMRTHRVNGELAQLVTAIEGYKAELGSYPPDNQNQSLTPIRRAQFNPLFFELTGATYDGRFTALNQKDPVAMNALKTAFGVDGIGNSARQKGDVKFQTVRFRPSQYTQVISIKEPPVGIKDNIILLTVPVNGPESLFMLDSVTPTGTPSGKVNVWQYDSSSTNRHNMATFDIWAVYNIGKRVITNGNWR